jgi:CHAD domain-containing protein
VRRLRSALGAHTDVATGETFEWLRRELKWVSARLGVARDWDVYATELLPPLLKERPQQKELSTLDEAAAEARARANGSARAAVRSRRYAHLIFRLGRVAAGADRPMIDPRCTALVLQFAAGLLGKRHEKVVERGSRLQRRSLHELHALRIAIKKLRYASEFFGSLFAEDRVKPFRGRVADLQERLGVINDQASMLRLAQEALPLRSPVLEALLDGWNAHVVYEERERLRKSWQQFRRTRRFW